MSTGVIILTQSRADAAANRQFLERVERVALRLDRAEAVLPAFVDQAQPDLATQVARLAACGVRNIQLVPGHLPVHTDLAAAVAEQLADCRRKHPALNIDWLPEPERGMRLEDVLVDRLTPAFFDAGKSLPVTGEGIEKLSHTIIDRRLAQEGLAPGEHAVYRRIIHSTADFSFIESVRIHPEAVQRGVAALRAGRPVICDVNMLKAGITKTAGEVLCAISDPAVVKLAQAQGSTRATAAMEFLAERLDGAIVAVGNAPTALWKLMEMARNHGPRPALVVGLPVGFVGAHESKAALAASDLVYITNLSPRGGSPAAAAAVNALALLAKQH